MTFVVEDGTGLANANAYIAVAFADSYFADRGNQKWAAVTDSSLKQQAIVRATDYIELRFGNRFIGDRLTTIQALSWPRQDIYTPEFPTGVPVQVQKACAEYAVRALDAALAPDPVVDETGRAVQSTANKVGPIEEKIDYVPMTSPSLIVPYPAADGLLRPVLLSSGGGVIRA